ncbi:hypothetical protein D3C87_196490 [compost metagenome]
MKTHAKTNQSAESSVQAKAKNQATEGSILQAYKNSTAQLAASEEEPIQQKENKTGLPDTLKSGVESMSGYSMDDVKVHYNSAKPAELQAHAYAQGTDIHVAPGQEKHLPHEAWHVVQQKQGRVQPTKQLKGTTNINDDTGLEKEADVMGAKANTNAADTIQQVPFNNQIKPVIQCAFAGPDFQPNNATNITYGNHQFNPLAATNATTGTGVHNEIKTAGERKNTSGSLPGTPDNMRNYQINFKRTGGLVRDPALNQASTKIHLINHRLENSDNTQNVASNILLGSKRANNPTHLHIVENFVINSLRHASKENTAYETSMLQSQTMSDDDYGGQVTFWPSANIPPASVLPAHFHEKGWHSPAGGITRTNVGPTSKKMKTGLVNSAPVSDGIFINPGQGNLPKHLWLIYDVSADYSGSPQFVQDNIQHETQNNLDPISGNPIDPGIDNIIQDFTNTWKDEAFPASFTSNAQYYYASWTPGTTYYSFSENPETIPTDT